ncbi:hypothetical protein K8374_17695 [Pseudomonas sp. p1(2021b)]|uniref:hypothetical protein n=1 Tax=Pseudomonas sp. p1(2021b) TaxID=2874628 RepID=UPI001CCD453D|nr:hypothetical protein [Pseudomonas sp. p1(2021b)]UBM24190.1 hypothetical protein K8374_17695 [Pseudomonas sp. p1(2021b)]
MDQDEIYKATRERATIELKEWAEQRFQRMAEAPGSGWDPEEQEWLGDHEEIDMEKKLLAKFRGKYPKDIIVAIAGELNFDGDWTRR